MSSSNTFLSLKELASRICLSPRTLRSHVQDPVNPLPAYLVGGKILFRWTEVERWLQSHRVRPGDAIDLADEILNQFERKNG